MARVFEDIMEQVKQGIIPKHWGSKPMITRAELKAKRKRERQNRKAGRR